MRFIVTKADNGIIVCKEDETTPDNRELMVFEDGEYSTAMNVGKYVTAVIEKMKGRGKF